MLLQLVIFVNVFLLNVHDICGSIETDCYERLFILDDERENGRNAMRSPTDKWPNGIVPYRFGEDFIERDRAAALHAMDLFHKKTCIQFVLRRPNHNEYIQFRKSDIGCGTLVGYKSEPVNVSLSERCLQITGAIQHELLHVLGLWHEQSRPDRDEYVDILWDNISPSILFKFYLISLVSFQISP